VKRGKGELNVHSKCHENEHSTTHFKCFVKGKEHTATIYNVNAYFLIKKNWKVTKALKFCVLTV